MVTDRKKKTGRRKGRRRGRIIIISVKEEKHRHIRTSKYRILQHHNSLVRVKPDRRKTIVRFLSQCSGAIHGTQASNPNLSVQ